MKEVEKIMFPHGRTDRQTDKINNREAMRKKKNFFFCSKWGLSAAHCFYLYNKNKFFIMFTIYPSRKIQTRPIVVFFFTKSVKRCFFLILLGIVVRL